MLCWGWLFQDQKKEVNRSHQFVMAVEMEMRREPSCPQRVCRWRRQGGFRPGPGLEWTGSNGKMGLSGQKPRP